MTFFSRSIHQPLSLFLFLFLASYLSLSPSSLCSTFRAKTTTNSRRSPSSPPPASPRGPQGWTPPSRRGRPRRRRSARRPCWPTSRGSWPPRARGRTEGSPGSLRRTTRTGGCRRAAAEEGADDSQVVVDLAATEPSALLPLPREKSPGLLLLPHCRRQRPPRLQRQRPRLPRPWPRAHGACEGTSRRPRTRRTRATTTSRRDIEKSERQEALRAGAG